jgi:carboxyl-terminal processing protease
MRVITLLAAALCMTMQAQDLNLASFEQVWNTIRETHWQERPGGLDWPAIRAEYRPRVIAARSTDEARTVIQEMLSRLGQTHFGIMGGAAALDLGEVGNANATSPGSAVTGMEIRVLGSEIVVTSVEPASPAALVGVRPGWVVRRIGDRSLQLNAIAQLPEYVVTHAVESRLSGPLGSALAIEFDTGSDTASGKLTLTLNLAPGRGVLASFGNLPPTRVAYESRRLPDNIAYVRLNVFLDLPRVIPAFDKSIRDCAPCAGVILDLRGNPGGIAGMASSMAGFLFREMTPELGTMHTRDAQLKFAINPRANAFTGPVAVLIDGGSASTSEILAGGLQDLGRARIFGTRSAAAALPSIITRLPNGDLFQYAIAHYVSRSGKELEGSGVTPDEEVKLTRVGLLAGHDAVLEAAQNWIRSKQ